MPLVPRPPFVVYADFNCPFCYALDRRLGEQLNPARVDWRPVEHAPDAGGSAPSVDELSELANEVFTVRHRAPEVPIVLPGVRPQTATANLVFTAVARLRPDLAPQLRSALYRAIWIEGQDISDPTRLSSVLAGLGLEGIEAEDADRRKLEADQVAWETGPFDRRIPSMLGPADSVLLGLCSPNEIGSFVRGEREAVQSSGSCSLVARSVVLVVGDPRPVWRLVSQLTPSLQVLLAGDVARARPHLDSGEVDLVLHVLGPGDGPSAELAAAIADAGDLDGVPLLVLDLAYTSERAWRAVQAGATDTLDALAPVSLTERRVLERLQARRQLVRLRCRERLDPLCQVPGRREFLRLLEQEWQRGLRSKMPLSLLLVDVDRFGALNKDHGHLHGDACLQGIAASLGEAAPRPSQRVCRYGGDEFVVILPDTGVAAARRVAEESLQTVRQWAQAFGDHHPTPGPTVSVGVVTLKALPDRDPQLLITLADEALRAAKAGGRDRFEVATP